MNPALGVGLPCLLCEVTVKNSRECLQSLGDHTPDKFCHQLGSYCYSLARKYGFNLPEMLIKETAP